MFINLYHTTRRHVIQDMCLISHHHENPSVLIIAALFSIVQLQEYIILLFQTAVRSLVFDVESTRCFVRVLGRSLISLVTFWEGYAFCVVKSISFRFGNFYFLIHKPEILAPTLGFARLSQYVGFFVVNVGVCGMKRTMHKLLLDK
jgi:hypothetical protein